MSDQILAVATEGTRNQRDPPILHRSRQSFFRSVSLFKGLGERDLDRLTSVFQPLTLEAGDVLCREGERLDYLYLVQRGNLSLLKAFLPLPEADGGDPQRHAERGVGEIEVQGQGAEHRRHDQRQNESHTKVTIPLVVENEPTSAACSSNASLNNQPSTTPARQSQRQQRRQASSPPPTSSLPMKVHHFNIGMVGRKEFIGEGGFTSAAYAGAGALETPEGVNAKDGVQELAIRAVEGKAKPTEARGRGGVSSSSGSHVGLSGGSSRRVGARHYMVSAIAESRVDAFAAKVSQLLPMQAAALKACWIEGREVRLW